ncbi:ubiquitin-associated protein 1-like [Pangasianodon hypophthalmus]|uniref:ubiquitin-associated protein 1-like n=1 Tax=Pangasianodon hypophthalmus TaxID=310915 RepID=UPI002307B1C5|nr:ubiquitin-associated protein 1-like [Pangasianodon hypophthalmus]
MSWLDDVPIKIPLGSLGEAKEEVELVTAPEIIVPDYLKILQETEYVFSLENWVLTGVQGGYSVPNALHPNTPSKAATCPPYWMLFSSPQQSRLASRWSSDFWEPNPRRRSRSLNAAQFRAMNDRVKFNISNSDDNDSSDNEEASFTRPKCNNSGLRRHELEMKDLHSHCSSHPLNLPSCCGLSSQQRSSILQCSLPNPEAQGTNLWKIQNHGDTFHELSASQQLLTLGHTTPLTQSPGLISSVPPAPTRPLGSHATVHDSSVELLSALSPEEQRLLEAVTEHGYPLRTAIIALQKMGHRSPEQILSYLVACDHLCQLGYDETQVEEALEMFQNCETKAKEFLHLLTQFHEMGFQQNAIKEVLLMHGNHRDRALEELMTHVA